MTKVIITGSQGRMGKALLAVAPHFPELKIVGEIDRDNNLGTIISRCDVVVDFSFHTATLGIAELCAKHKKAIVIGTTGHSVTEQSAIRRLQTQIPMVWSSNYSRGVNALFWLVRKMTEALGPNFDIEILEMHHRLKKDAPSGTAKTFFEILSSVRKEQLNDSAILARHGRHGMVGEREQTEIGIHSMRGGDVVCDHTVIFAAPGERVELAHSATNRETFAYGALQAAIWVTEQSSGLYDMQDVLGLNDSVSHRGEESYCDRSAIPTLVTH